MDNNSESFEIAIDMMWAISVVALRPSRAHIAGIEIQHEAMIIWALSREEVIGKAIDKYSAKHEIKNGWSVNASNPIPLRNAIQDELGGFSEIVDGEENVE